MREGEGRCDERAEKPAALSAREPPGDQREHVPDGCVGKTGLHRKPHTEDEEAHDHGQVRAG